MCLYASAMKADYGENTKKLLRLTKLFQIKVWLAHANFFVGSLHHIRLMALYAQKQLAGLDYFMDFPYRNKHNKPSRNKKTTFSATLIFP
jgi:hypothetical protein